MKKLFVLMMIGSLLVGCTSANDQNDKKSAKPAGSAVALKDNDTKSKDNQKEKDDSEKEEKKQQEEEKQQKQSNAPKKESSKNDGTSSKTEKKDNNQSNSNKNESNQEPPVIQQAKADQVFAQINAYRTQNGKEPFTYSSELRSRCDSHAFAMAQKEALWHSGDGAECITNYDDPFSAWVSSPPHNKLLLSNNTEAAVGIYYYNGYYYSVFQTRW